MIEAIHLLINNGVFKMTISSEEKNKKILNGKEKYSYARLVRKEDYEMNDINDVSSNIGVALMSSIKNKGDSYSVFFVKDEDVLDFLFFENIIIFKTATHVYSYDWKNEEVLFKRYIQAGLSIDLVEPSIIIQTSFLNSFFIDPYTGKVLLKINGEGRFIDSFYDNGKIVVASVVQDTKDIHNTKTFIHFSFYIKEKHQILELQHEHQISFPYEELEWNNHTYEHENHYELLEFHRMSDKKLRSIYEEKEKNALQIKIYSLQDKENVMRTKGNLEKAEEAKEERNKLLNEMNAIEHRYKKEWFYNDGIKGLVRIVGFSSKEHVFYFSFDNVLFVMDMDKKEWTRIGYTEPNVSLIKTIPTLMKAGGIVEDVLILKRDIPSKKEYHFEAVEIHRVSNNETSIFPFTCSQMNHNNFIARLSVKNLQHCFFQHEDGFVKPFEMLKQSVMNDSLIEKRYGFSDTMFLSTERSQDDVLFCFLRNDFSVTDIENNKLIQKNFKKISKEFEETTISERLLNGKKVNLSIYDVSYITEEDKEIIRKLTSQKEWFFQTCKAEREIISVVIPDMIQKYKENNEENYLNAINELLGLLKEIDKKKELSKKETSTLDSSFAVDYARSLID